MMKWDTPIYQSSKSQQYSDYKGKRYLVKRTRKNAREFTCIINSFDFLCMHPTIDKAKEHCEKIALLNEKPT